MIDQVRDFWQNNPLFKGESQYKIGSREYFDEHTQVYIEDTFAGKLDDRIFSNLRADSRILDMGCGPGFWTEQFAKRGFTNLHFSDLTEAGLKLATERLSYYPVHYTSSIENAESTAFADQSFDHINCQGVIHHTPHTEQCVKEFHRILKKNGTACISVYYKGPLIRAYPLIGMLFGAVFSKLGFGLKGRGRENIFALKGTDEIVRHYDGANNPIGKAYSKRDFFRMVQPYFQVEDCYRHFFPARALPFKIPRFLHRFLDKSMGFMIYVNLKRKD